MDQPQQTPRPLERKLRFDEICDRYEACLIAGQQTALAAFLDEVPESERGSLLRELLTVELDVRASPPEAPSQSIDEYLTE